MPTGLNLHDLARAKGISGRLAVNDQYAMTIGAISQEALATWLGSIDALINAAYGGGFELTPLEAMACGTPAIVNDCSAMSELGVPGWRVKGQPFWNGHHQADWQVPFIRDIVRCLKQAYAEYESGANEARREKARKFALRYDADKVLREHWVPVLRELEAARRGMLRIGGDRDAAVARLSAAWSDGRLDAEAFGDRAARALSAPAADDLIPLVADLPEAA
jgi:glycosyltransferase involved in cell wall biosynthesis